MRTKLMANKRAMAGESLIGWRQRVASSHSRVRVARVDRRGRHEFRIESFISEFVLGGRVGKGLDAGITFIN